MIVLGLIDSRPAAAAVVIDGTIVAAIAEERLCRLKFANGMPLQAIEAVLAAAGIAPEDIDAVAVAQKSLLFRPTPEPWDGWFHPAAPKPLRKRLVDLAGSRLAPILGSSPIARDGYQALKWVITSDRRWKLPGILRNQFQIGASVRFYDHHLCHAASAYYLCNHEKALVITLDGGGDGRSGSVYLGKNGQLTPIASVDSFNSLGNFYSYITKLCGFKAENHEGKVTGLAALGVPRYANILREFVRYEDPGQIRYCVPMYRESALQKIAERLPQDFDRADLAASVQLVLEEIGVAFVRYWVQKTGCRHVAVAGGVFSNVKFNQRVHEIPEVDSLFVQPAMDDSGLAVGGALVALSQQPDRASRLLQRLPHMYFGTDYSDSAIVAAIDESGYDAVKIENIHRRVAHLLADGYVVARFTGRMEYGPRALGNRSILYQTTDRSVNDWLNESLNRTEFMPFAPVTLADYAHDCYVNLAGAEDAARFMTITFNCTPLMQRLSPGVVHVDGTARPQLVDADSAPDLHAILTCYHRLTGIPSLINTSFNIHGEPIVCSPQDALRSFKTGKLDYLAIGHWLVANPAVSTDSVRRPRRGVVEQ